MKVKIYLKDSEDMAIVKHILSSNGYSCSIQEKWICPNLDDIAKPGVPMTSSSKTKYLELIIDDKSEANGHGEKE